MKAIGLQKGIKKGKAEAVKEMALTAHRNGYSVAQIQAVTNLSEEEVNAIISLVNN
jgi:predicted transposase YdaD